MRSHFLYKYEMANAVVSIKPSDRARVLISNRQAKIAQSAHAYVRGNTLHFYEWLKKQCGHLHFPAVPRTTSMPVTPAAFRRRMSESASSAAATDMIRGRHLTHWLNAHRCCVLRRGRRRESGQGRCG